MEDLFWDKYKIGKQLLKRDIEYGHIREKEKQEIIDFAWKTGEKAAERIKEKYPFCLPSQIVQKEHIILEEEDTEDGWNYSEYLPLKNQIILYKKKIISGTLPQEERYKKYQTYEKKREFFIAHELFHYLEHTDISVRNFRKQYSVTVLDLKIFRLKRELVSMSEIAAYGFTRAFLRIEEEKDYWDTLQEKVVK